MSYAEDFTDLRYSDFNLRRMCAEGVARFNAQPEYNELRFNVINSAEERVVRAEMLGRFPDTPFTTTRLFA